MSRKPRQRSGEYEVGYGKPPEHSRFKPGQSGNPRGRPKGSANLSTLLEQALDEKVVVNENGRRRKVTKADAIATQLVNKAASADFRAISLVFALRDRQRGAPDQATNNGASGRPHLPGKAAELPPYDYSRLTTAELEQILDAADVLHKRKEPPGIPMPPDDPPPLRTLAACPDCGGHNCMRRCSKQG
jgi:hypothetical protein